MKIHSDTLTIRDIYDALPRGCYFADFKPEGSTSLTCIEYQKSRKREHGFVVRLSGSSPYNMQRLLDKAATWDEWGIFIAELFRRDINAVIGQYKSLDDFIEQTTAERDRIAQWRPDLVKWHKAPWLKDDGLIFASARGYYAEGALL